MVLPNLTTNTLYEIKVGAASLSTINPHQVIFGSYSEPQKVDYSFGFSMENVQQTYKCSLNILDFAATRLRKNPTNSTEKPNRLQFDNASRCSVQLLWNYSDSTGIRSVAVSCSSCISLSHI